MFSLTALVYTSHAPVACLHSYFFIPYSILFVHSLQCSFDALLAPQDRPCRMSDICLRSKRAVFIPFYSSTLLQCSFDALQAPQDRPCRVSDICIRSKCEVLPPTSPRTQRSKVRRASITGNLGSMPGEPLSIQGPKNTSGTYNNPVIHCSIRVPFLLKTRVFQRQSRRTSCLQVFVLLRYPIGIFLLKRWCVLCFGRSPLEGN